MAVEERGGGSDPLLNLILQKYIQAARDSIRGPVALKTDVRNVPKHPSEKHDYKGSPREESFLRSTNIDGYTVYGFNVGGEIRICFSEIVQTILKEINVHEIFKKRDNLLIFTSKCTPKQMDELKYRGVLPWTTTSSNLITKSDAFRLIGALQGNLAPKADLNKRSCMSFEVYHECFGGCIGIFDPELYTEASAACIRCTECNGLYTTRKFVSHNHTSFDEVHTCHWGFDSSRWRSYIMLVEQKASIELLSFWDKLKYKFDVTQPKIKCGGNADRNHDADFVAYIHSPNHKKAMVSPIENLRNQEAQLESVVKYESKHQDGSSAFRPWSPKPSRSLLSRKEDTYRQNHHFLFPSKQEIPSSRSHSFPASGRLYSGHNHGGKCSCCPTAPVYTDCQQCKKAHAGCHRSSDQMEDTKPKLDSLNHSACPCDQCRKKNYQAVESVEGSLEDIIDNYTSKDNKLTTSSRDLARLLSSELKRLSIVQDEKLHEMVVSNQRLQTELQLVKIENHKKLNDIRESKAHAEQELETLHRERQKDMAMFKQLRWELSQEVNNRKAMGEANECSTLQKEVALLKSQLHQSIVERGSLEKQLEWHVQQRRTVDWTPYPAIGRKFSDPGDKHEKPAIVHSNHPSWSSQMSISTPAEQKEKRETAPLSPVNKSRKIDTELEAKEEESSDIEVED